MKEKYEDKSLAKINKKSIFYKIRLFFRNIFNYTSNSKNINTSIKEFVTNDKRKSVFIEKIKKLIIKKLNY